MKLANKLMVNNKLFPHTRMENQSVKIEIKIRMQ